MDVRFETKPPKDPPPFGPQLRPKRLLFIRTGIRPVLNDPQAASRTAPECTCLRQEAIRACDCAASRGSSLPCVSLRCCTLAVFGPAVRALYRLRERSHIWAKYSPALYIDNTGARDCAVLRV
ncbi:hypothetical protein PHYPO_G00168180 [Pangasianodon hypophthalmus]|uniref:Uncharacterized protein n=1 Tax=Pangasianodon hypophthalmus TaxID=310915 RepID=A0A5N5JHE9_PANHP|nr:hypothetical protein PHYPO_G00168180 [Pangasianodon hypophthalmus]